MANLENKVGHAWRSEGNDHDVAKRDTLRSEINADEDCGINDQRDRENWSF